MSDWRLRTMSILALLLLVGPGPGAAQEFDRPSRLEERLAPNTVERLRSIAERAERDGVPAELLRRKVNEGISKGVTGARLERAIADYADRLVEARRLAGPRASAPVLAAAAEALERGVPPDRIRRFLTVHPNPVRAGVGLRVFADLRDAGVPDGPAMRGVGAALDRGLRGERLLALSAAVRRRVAAGQDPTEALRAELSGDRSPVRSRRDRGGGRPDGRRP